MSNSLKQHFKRYAFQYQTALIFILLIITAFGMTESSPIFATNQWDDTNVSFTLGRGWLHNLWPYQDLFEQRGPVMYMIYAVAAMISSTNFMGLFVVEVVFMVSVFFIIAQFAKSLGFIRSRFVVSFISVAIFYGANVFGFGGSPEELSFPFIAGFFLCVLPALFMEKMPATGKLITAGALFALVFWLKYSLIGYFLGYYIVYGIYLLIKHQKLFWQLLWTALAGFIGVSAIILGFFAITGHFTSLIEVYIVQNLTLYGSRLGGFVKVFVLLRSFGFDVTSHPFMAALLSAQLVIVARQYWARSHVFIVLLSMVIFEVITVYISGNTQWYYLLALIAFISFMIPHTLKFLLNANQLQQPLSTIKWSGARTTLLLLVGIVILTGSNINLKNGIFVGQTKYAIAQTDFGTYMMTHSKTKHPTLIEYNGIDSGFFLHANALPTVRYFEQTNFSYKSFPDSYDSQLHYIKTRKTQYVVMRSNRERDLRNQMFAAKPKLFTQYTWNDETHARHGALMPTALPLNYQLIRAIYTSANGEDSAIMLFQARKTPLKAIPKERPTITSGHQTAE